MGSPYLLAHGLGQPVEDAVTRVKIYEAGDYTVWVRTFDWVARWKAPGKPGRFNLLVDGKRLSNELGVQGETWQWQKEGTVQQTLPLAFQLVSDDQNCELVRIFDSTGNSLGSAIRTGPLVDSIEGYQGPSELVLFVDDNGILKKIRLRRTFDNEPYVRYVKQESSFWAELKGKFQQWLARFHRTRTSRTSTSRLPSGMSGPRKNWVFIQQLLQVYAYTSILLALGWLVFAWPINLAWLEPFDAYAWRIGVSVSLSVWLASLALAWHKPIAYCRLACPTGKTLEYVRHRANRWRIGTVDAILAPLMCYYGWYY